MPTLNNYRTLKQKNLNNLQSVNGDEIVVGNISMNENGMSLGGDNIDMAGGQIQNIPLIQSQNNQNIIVEGKGTGDVILKTGNTNRVVIDENGDITVYGSLILSRINMNPIAIGVNAGLSNQSIDCVAVGYGCGQTNQSSNAVAMGYLAGQNTQGTYGIAIGQLAGCVNQNQDGISIGRVAGFQQQGSLSIAIGAQAGQLYQGSNAIAIGYGAGQTNQHSNSLCINATNSILNTGNNNACYINPIRNVDGISTGVLSYNSTTKEITYSNNLNFDNGTLSIDVSNDRVGVNNTTPSYALDVNGDVNLSTGSQYRINAVSVLSDTTLGSSVLNSSLTSLGTLSSLNVGGNIVQSSGTASLQALTVPSLSCNGNISGTLTTSSQPNITSVGTLSSLNVNGNVNISSGNNYLVNNSPIIPTQTGNSGKFLTTNGSTTSWQNVPLTTPSGSNTQIQFNNNGSFGASPNLTFNSSVLSIANQIRVLDTSTGTNSLNLQQVSNQSYINWGSSNNLNFTTGSSPALTRGFWSGSTGQLTLYNGLSVSGTTQFSSGFNSNGISNSGLISTDNLIVNQKYTVGSQQSPNQPLWYRGGTITCFRGQTSGNPFNVPLPVLNATGFVCGSIYNSVGNWMSFTGSSRGSSGINIQMNGGNPSVSSITFSLNGVRQTGLQFSGTALNTTCYYCVYVLSDGFNG